jgi:hypothetical protein
VRAKQAQLQASLQTAATQPDVDKVVAQYAAAINDLLARIAHLGSAQGASGVSNTPRLDPASSQSSSMGRVTLLLACFALVLSLVALLGGSLVARRQVTKALIEAGLI